MLNSVPATSDRLRTPDLPRQATRRTVWAVHYLARRRGRLPTRPVRHSGEEGQGNRFETVKASKPVSSLGH